MDSWKNKPMEMLAMLKNFQIITNYNLTLYCMLKDGDQRTGSLRQCGSIIQNPLCNQMVIPFLQEKIKHALENKRPLICKAYGGLLGFIVPFRSVSAEYCLVGEGVREESINIRQLEELAKMRKTDAFAILEQLIELPVKTLKEVEDDARQLRVILLYIHEEKTYRSLYDNTKAQLSSIVRSMSQMDELQTAEEVCFLCGKLFGTLFDFPKIAIALRDEKHEEFLVNGVWGLTEGMASIPENKLSFLSSNGLLKKDIGFTRDLKNIFPEVIADRVAFFPLESNYHLFGFIALFDGELQHMDETLAELITNSVAGKLMQLKKDRERLPAGYLSSSLMTLTNTLLSAESKEELYRNLLETAADLVGASRGSIMLVDKTGKRLQIGFSKGMNERLAQSVTVNVGEGIAGKVACDGLPLLVDDVEKDLRVGIQNRSRFKTKSLLCMPLKLKDKTIGVINLSDKQNMKVFTEEDMNILTSFGNLASLMLERTWTMERYSFLEQLSVTDSLTGLYNRRFMRNRLEEEISRSRRHESSISVIFMDLDHFKNYNDLCGHLAGDRALRKTAEILKAMVRDMDIVVRYGGEEFCIILPDTAKREANVAAERIRWEIEKETFLCEENLPLGRLTASFGIATFPEDGNTFTTLIHSADMAMYRAKAEGRNRIVSAVPVQSVINDTTLSI
jgi:diguanylate cyclase (GGDEF)-like protein